MGQHEAYSESLGVPSYRPIYPNLASRHANAALRHGLFMLYACIPAGLSVNSCGLLKGLAAACKACCILTLEIV